MPRKKSIADEIAELREMAVPELVERYEAVFGKPPRVKHRQHLWRRVAWKIQEQRFGGLSTVAKRRLDELIAELDLGPLGEAANGERSTGRIERAGRAEPKPGTTLTRVWRAREIWATKVDGGWEHEGEVFRSLSAVAKAVTSAHMSGPAFFRLTQRGGGGR